MTLKNELPPVAVIVNAIAFTLTLGSMSVAKSAEVVEFESVEHTYAPSAFRAKRAKALGVEPEAITEPATPLKGFLVKPSGNGLFPAVVLMHGCSGIWEWDEVWRARLVDWGYVVLNVDSFGPRGVTTQVCSELDNSAGTWVRALDAHGAKNYLSTLPFVDPTRIGVMGMSHGGWTVLHIVRRATSADLHVEPFRAAIALYPLCKDSDETDTPTLILIGEKNRGSECIRYEVGLPIPHDTVVKVFPGAHHVFDHEGIDTEVNGVTYRYDAKAAKEATQMTREFFAKWL